MSINVLSIGQCGVDHLSIARFLSRTLQARTDAAGSAAEGLKKLAAGSYHLVLVNRIIDGDASSGIDLIAKVCAQRGCPPVMLVSNLPEAQAAAAAVGAMAGFGKSSMGDADVARRLKTLLIPGPQSPAGSQL